MGSLANLWLEKQVAQGQFMSLLRENKRGQTNVLSTLTPIEHVLLVFKKVIEGDYDVPDIPFMIEHYLMHAAKCYPAQVTYVNGMMCHQLIAFAEHVFAAVFPEMKDTYVDTQIAFLLSVGGADALAVRMVSAHPHPDADWT